MRQQQTQQPVALVSPQGSQGHFMRSQSVGQTAGPPSAQHPVSAVSPNSQPPMQMGVNYESGWGAHPPPYVNQMSGEICYLKFPNLIKLLRLLKSIKLLIQK